MDGTVDAIVWGNGKMRDAVTILHRGLEETMMTNETQYHVDLGGKLNGIRLVVSLLMRVSYK